MNSCIYRGIVRHARVAPVRHAFEYPFYFYGLDLDELPELARRIRWFGYNQRRLVAIHDDDYLERAAGTIRAKLMRRLAERGLDGGVDRVFLVTAARYFNYVFNPVSFYYCLRRDGSLVCAVAEVNNTFRERHVYILPPEGPVNGRAHCSARKAFHVSPFNDMHGEYRVSLSSPTPDLDIRVDLVKGEQVVLQSQLTGRAFPFSAATLASTLARYPLVAAMTMPRILAQAAALHFRRKLPVFPKPAPAGPDTMRCAPPTFFQRAARRLASSVLRRLRHGTLDLVEPDGASTRYGSPAASVSAVMRVRDAAFYTRVIRDGEIGLGESYMLGEWDSPDLTGVIRLLIENRDALDRGDLRTAWLGRGFARALHLARANTPSGSRRNIAAHYDLSNDFFQLFLDRSMMYSCAVYAGEGDSLEAAQSRKLRMILDKARIEPQHHVLEIGSGWGGFAIEAARQTGCRVTSITLSEQQLALARQRAAEAGVADRVEFKICDYRQIEGQFDRLVSVEMLEAVGHENLGPYFATCDRALRPGGRAVIQVIAMPDGRYEAYRRSVDWIQKHIFPGGHLPSLAAMTDAMTRYSRLAVETTEDIGIHYARTLRDWRERFNHALPRVRALGFDEVFVRKWVYYLCYCEAAFATRALQDLQLVLSRRGA